LQKQKHTQEGEKARKMGTRRGMTRMQQRRRKKEGDMGRGNRKWLGKEHLSNYKDVEEAEVRRGTNTKRHSIHTF